ncbi:secretory calcium-binding phosphoprotein 9 isoform X2 [Mugil cephalus]|uniref:secretory calcium-binding phosphoprotein 9 isoform X2 n=1 Tax=Mugil cephalus TaxID=48193 RepID=UPI001FB7D3B7|nr:secretory calcium-binding phosphoprotein 9 isoform X2 [Mugil cephalus]
MKFFLLTAFFVATISCTQRLLAAMAAMNGQMMNPANPGVLAGGLNVPLVAGGGAGFIGQPQFAQFVPRIPAFAVTAPVPNAYPFPAVNAFPYMGAPQMPQVNPPQQPMMMVPGGVMQQQQQQLPPQAEIQRFRRQLRKPGNTLEASVDTQIPAPSESTTTTAPCEQDDHQETY